MPSRATLLRTVVSILCCFPAIDLWRVLSRYNPKFLEDYDFPVFSLAIRASGAWAFIFIFLALAVTPVQKLTRQLWLGELRRPLGVFAFLYCLLHLAVYIVIGQKWRFEYVIPDARLAPSRIPGWAATVLLVPLALTSADFMVRWLGGKAWKRLHLLVYPATALAIWHMYWTENDNRKAHSGTEKALWVFGILILARLLPKLKKSATTLLSRVR